MCVVALVRGEVCAGTLARRTPPNWDGALDSALGKSFTTRPILSLLSLSRKREGSEREHRRRAPRLRCTPECRVCVVALVRGEMCVGTLARRTPPNRDGVLDSALGKSFTTRPILSLVGG